MPSKNTKSATPTQAAATAEERARLEVLHSYEVLDTPPDPALDALMQLVSELLGVPIALISLVDETRQWFKARHGTDLESTPREIAFCNEVVRNKQPLIVSDATKDPRFKDNPLVLEDPKLRFYAGVPLLTSEGAVLGSLCGVSSEVKTLDPRLISQLVHLADLAVERMARTKRDAAFERARRDVEENNLFFEFAQDMTCVASLEGWFVRVNRQWTEVLGYTAEELLSQPFSELIHPDDLEATATAMSVLADAQEVTNFRNRYLHKDGSYRWLSWSAKTHGDEDDTKIFAAARDVTSLVRDEEVRERQRRVHALIADAMSRFLDEGASSQWWSNVLDALEDIVHLDFAFVCASVASPGSGWFRAASAPLSKAADSAPDALLSLVKEMADARAPRSEVLADSSSASGAWQTIVMPIRYGKRQPGGVALGRACEAFQTDELFLLQPIVAFLGSIFSDLDLEEERRARAEEMAHVRDLQGRILASSTSGFLAFEHSGRLAMATEQARYLLGQPFLKELESCRTPLEILVTLCGETAARSVLEHLEDNRERHAGGVTLTLRPGLQTSVLCKMRVTLFQSSTAEQTGLLVSVDDMEPQDALRQSKLMNARLEDRLMQLRSQQRSNEVLSDCVEYLQSCLNLEEGYEVAARAMERLFPLADVALFAVDAPASDKYTLVRSTNRLPAFSPPETVQKQSCWALRSRRTHGTWSRSTRPGCPHVAAEQQYATFCVPLSSLDHNVALLLVRFDARSIDLDTFEARQSHFFAISQSISGALSTISLRETLERQALFDELTGLYNRRAFQVDADRAMARLRRGQRHFAFALLDVDHFKRINDELGHDVGDKVLASIAHEISSDVRTEDVVARLGGEEFGVLFGDIERDEAAASLDRLLDRVRARCVVDERRVTVSAGLVHTTDFPPDFGGFNVLYRQCDQALYAAKNAGRNRWEWGGATAEGAPSEKSQQRDGMS